MSLVLWLALALILVPASAWSQSPGEINTPADPGYTGLWDMPNGRVIPDWNLRWGIGSSKPYYYFYITLGLFDRLEINGRMTGISGDTPLGPEYGDYKDKAIDVKLTLLKEKGLRPALALGATDIHGTGLFTSRYFAASKRIGALDVTLGLAQGMLGGKSSAERNKISGYTSGGDSAEKYLTSGDKDYVLFGGLEYAWSRKLILSAEYSSIKWENIRGGHEAKSPITLGVKYRAGDYWLLRAAYARGEEFSAGVTWQIPLDAEGPLGWQREPAPITDEKTLLEADQADDNGLARLLVNALTRDGFSVVRVIVARPDVWIELQNNKYNSTPLAFNRAFLIADGLLPSDVRQFYLAISYDGIFQNGLKASREHIRSFIDVRIDKDLFLTFSKQSMDRSALWKDFREQERIPRIEATPLSGWNLRLKPTFKMFLNDPSGFFKYRFSLDLIGSGTPWKGGLFLARLCTPLYNNISSSNKALEAEPARTDFADYLSRKSMHISSYGFDQIFELPSAAQARFGIGAFEETFAGFGAEVFKMFGDGRFGAGLEGAIVWKRDMDNDFALHPTNREPYQTYHLNLYGQPLPGSGLELGLRIGRFLAGDHGVRLEACRTFKHFTIGGWYTATDTSGFKSSFNKDYNDKGVFISFPISIFSSRPRAGRFNFGISPWTRDPGQMVYQFRSLYPMGSERPTPYEMKKHAQEMQW